MQSARDSSNVYLMDRVRAKERMRRLTATAPANDESSIEVIAYVVVAGIVWTLVGLVWWLA